MIPALRVVAPGLHTTLQDLGRRGFQDVGVPVSGPLDRVSLTLANALVGNPPDAAALEILAQGPTLEVLAHSVRLAIVGGNGGIDVLGDAELLVPAGESISLTRGMRLRSRSLGKVSCAYLALEGGFATNPVLRSRSTYTRGGFGGFGGRSLLAGDILPAFADAAKDGPERALPSLLDPGLEQPIRIVLGPQDDFFSEDAIEALLSSRYTISPQADRMGYRLEGAQLEHTRGYNIVSDPIVAGSIQVPGSGQPIVLLADAQTTGGYPKIGTVISADLPVLGRRRPGDLVRFTAIALPEAEALRREQEAQVRGTIANLFEVKRGALLDAQALYETNLVSGMVDAFEGPAA
jgi:biotin-dependent carboxylase-like uncharacterized protein